MHQWTLFLLATCLSMCRTRKQLSVNGLGWSNQAALSCVSCRISTYTNDDGRCRRNGVRSTSGFIPPARCYAKSKQACCLIPIGSGAWWTTTSASHTHLRHLISTHRVVTKLSSSWREFPSQAGNSVNMRAIFNVTPPPLPRIPGPLGHVQGNNELPKNRQLC